MNPFLTIALKKALPVVLGVFGKFLSSVVDSFLKDKAEGGLDVLDEVARVTAKAVRSLASADLTDVEKKKAAILVAKREGQRLGREISDSFASILVDSAWKAVKAGKA